MGSKIKHIEWLLGKEGALDYMNARLRVLHRAILKEPLYAVVNKLSYGSVTKEGDDWVFQEYPKGQEQTYKKIEDVQLDILKTYLETLQWFCPDIEDFMVFVKPDREPSISVYFESLELCVLCTLTKDNKWWVTVEESVLKHGFEHTVVDMFEDVIKKIEEEHK